MLNNDNLFKSIEKEDNPEYSETEDLDFKLQEEIKQFKTQQQKLSHNFRLITHPFNILKIGIVIGFLFLVFRYISFAFPENNLLKSISNDFENFMKYILTAIISSIITSFVNNLNDINKD